MNQIMRPEELLVPLPTLKEILEQKNLYISSRSIL